jgi:carboxylesterase type B
MSVLCSVFALLILDIQIAKPEALVTIPQSQVTYRGTTHSSVEHFKNIKFAHSLTNPLRFAPPVPYLPRPGSSINASSTGLAYPQTQSAMPPFFDSTENTSEDCLNLRIARPSGTKKGDKLPVVVWLHGGGVKGSAYDSHFEPDNLITLSSNLSSPLIYVALNYRLTIFGFARLPLLKDQCQPLCGP